MAELLVTKEWLVGQIRGWSKVKHLGHPGPRMLEVYRLALRAFLDTRNNIAKEETATTVLTADDARVIREALVYARGMIGETMCGGDRCRLPHCRSCYGDDATQIDYERIPKAIAILNNEASEEKQTCFCGSDYGICDYCKGV